MKVGLIVKKKSLLATGITEISLHQNNGMHTERQRECFVEINNTKSQFYIADDTHTSTSNTFSRKQSF